MTSWTHVEAALNGILDRRWYTNHGPLARLLEAEWSDATGRKHAVAVVNPTIGLVMIAEALSVSGDVLLSALAPPRCAQALSWAGLRPVFRDIHPDTFGLELPPDANGCAILATCAADSFGERAAPVFWDGVDGAPGPTLIDLPGHGDGAGAACILTDDDPLAARLRNIRSSYGAGPPVPVVKTANGRLSEAQAAMALLVPAGRSFGSLAAESLAPILEGKRWLPYGREFIVIAEAARARDALARELTGAGLTTRPLSLDHRATACVHAASVAERAVVIRPHPRIGG